MHTQDFVPHASCLLVDTSYFIKGNRLPYPDLRSIHNWGFALYLASEKLIVRHASTQKGAFACTKEI